MFSLNRFLVYVLHFMGDGGGSHRLFRDVRSSMKIVVHSKVSWNPPSPGQSWIRENQRTGMALTHLTWLMVTERTSGAMHPPQEADSMVNMDNKRISM